MSTTGLSGPSIYLRWSQSLSVPVHTYRECPFLSHSTSAAHPDTLIVILQTLTPPFCSYSSLARPDNTSLSGLSVFELSTGAVLWQGVPDAQETLAVNGTCTDIAVPRGDMHFACTCLQTLPPDTPAMASSIGSGSLTRVKTALCAYTIAVESGKLRYEVRSGVQMCVRRPASVFAHVFAC